MERIGRHVLVLVLLGLLLPAQLGTVGEPIDGLPEGVGIRLLDVPTEDAEDPRANTYIVDHAIPGAVVQRRLLVTNGTGDPVPIRMVGAPARADGGWVVEGAGQAPPPDALAAWIDASPSQFTLAPGSGTEVAVTIRVPGDAPPGERYAAVVAEPPPVDAGGGVGVVSRVGVRVYLSVGGEEPVTDFTIDTLTASRDADGTPLVEVGVTNTGGRAIDVGGELELVSQDGVLSAGPFPTVLQSTLAPGNRGSVFVELPAELSPGPWVATATMRSGLVERQAQATITFPTEPGTVDDPVVAERIESARRALLPVATALLLFAIAALWLLLVWNRRDEHDDEEDVPTLVSGDSRPTSTGEHPR